MVLKNRSRMIEKDLIGKKETKLGNSVHNLEQKIIDRKEERSQKKNLLRAEKKCNIGCGGERTVLRKGWGKGKTWARCGSWPPIRKQ